MSTAEPGEPATPDPGRIVILNGPPRAGKSSIAAAIQAGLDGIWMNIGVDAYAAMMPPGLRPGIGLRPGGERPELAILVPRLYAALYGSIAAHSRLGFDVVADLGHHVADPAGRAILAECAGLLRGLPAWLIGVHCPIGVIMERRRAGQDPLYLSAAPHEPVPDPVLRWQAATVAPGLYDLELDTAVISPEDGAAAIARRMEQPPTALSRVAG